MGEVGYHMDVNVTKQVLWKFPNSQKSWGT